MEVNQLQMKLQERERVHTQNRDLVTKNCAQQSQIENYKRQIQALQNKFEELQNEKQQKIFSNKPGMGIGVLPRSQLAQNQSRKDSQERKTSQTNTVKHSNADINVVRTSTSKTQEKQ
jgi:hypothetical protein